MEFFELFLYKRIFSLCNINRRVLRYALLIFKEDDIKKLELKSSYMEDLLKRRLKFMRYDVFICLYHDKNGTIVADKDGTLIGIKNRNDISLKNQLRIMGYSNTENLCIRLCLVPWENMITYDGVVDVISPIISQYSLNVLISFREKTKNVRPMIIWDVNNLNRCVSLLDIEENEYRDNYNWKKWNIENWIDAASNKGE
jgi:hypothetical protein